MIIGVLAQAPWLSHLPLSWLAPAGLGRDRHRFRHWVKTIDQRISARSNGVEDDAHSFFISQLSKNLQSSTQVIADEIRVGILNIETTTTLLSASFFYLIHYPKAYDTLAQEIRSQFNDENQVHSGPMLASCEYLSACINETLRMSPPAVGSQWREVQADEMYVDANFVPKGAEVGVCIYAAHHNERYWQDSFVFEPERWLHKGGKPRTTDEAPDTVFNPFSIGPRACPGEGLAILLTKIVLATTIASMDFRKSKGNNEGEGEPGSLGGRDRVAEYQLFSNLTSHGHGPVVEFRKRSSGGDVLCREKQIKYNGGCGTAAPDGVVLAVTGNQ
ncbi:MAG: hypothetical protein Q9170_004672 [Blastenia crenularia]